MKNSCPISNKDCFKRLENFEFEYHAEVSSELLFGNKNCQTGCIC